MLGMEISHRSHISEMLQDKMEQAQAACAEMRIVLDTFKHADGCICEASFCMPDGSHPRHTPACEKFIHALSSDCGKGWISPEKGKVVREALQAVEEDWRATVQCGHAIQDSLCTRSIVRKALAALEETI